ncbi:GNAT family N-acetyltransferase [Paucilactobacillus kaifaensis]|uniref:GNAT family N-acetyltransferase n=1 Tax=Paucilactobacillus kaifaensis TaxID=2559921 RepID=UPI0010F5A459|nr:GNAT family N-acetyltransferase [Paucilactobacillus kaifaensis]
MAMKIKRVTTADLPALRDISIKTFTDTFGEQNTAANMQAYLDKAYNKEQLLQELETLSAAFYFALVDGELAGYLKVNVDNAQSESMGADSLEVERIYILPQFKRQGLGKQLINYAIELAKNDNKRKVWLGVWEQNFAAQKFYQFLGFKRESEHSFYMGTDPQTDYIIVKEI